MTDAQRAATDERHRASALGAVPLRIVAMAMLAYWLQLLGHELAHEWGRDLFAGGADLSARWPRRAQIGYFAGGPAFTSLLAIVSALAALRIRTARGRIAAACLALSAASRAAWTSTAVLLGRPHDEVAVARFLGVPAGVLQGAEALIAAVVVVVIVRLLPAETRGSTLRWMAIGMVLGLVSAMTLGNALGIPVGGF